MVSIDSIENKAKLWNICIEKNIFQNIPNELLPNIQKLFEDSINIFKNQNITPDNLDYMNDQVINHFKTELVSFGSISKESIVQDRKNDFERRLEEKQREFNQLMQKDKPEDVEFKQVSDEPIGENMNDLIEKHNKEREQELQKVFNQQGPNDNLKNEIISNSVVEKEEYSTIQPGELQQTSVPSLPMNINNSHQISSQDINIIIDKIDKLERIVNGQSQLLTNLIKSQVNIMNILKTKFL